LERRDEHVSKGRISGADNKRERCTLSLPKRKGSSRFWWKELDGKWKLVALRNMPKR